MADRLITDLAPDMQVATNAWVAKMKAANNDQLIICTKRTQAEQEALWEEGRELHNGVWVIVNNSEVRTWTLNSKHLTGHAFDFVIMVNGKPDWNMKFKDKWNQAVAFGKQLGLTQVIGKHGQVLEFGHLQLG